MTDNDYMRLALKLAKRGRTSPNPMVGAVIVNNGDVVGKGYHPRAGEPHAEVFALEEAGEKARGATMYVTLEPCSHFGRTPPCADALIKAGIARVVAAMKDPDPKVAGKGIEKLHRAGVDVKVGLCEQEARELNEAYVKHRMTGIPLVILKAAMSLDGKIATRAGDSKWISNERSRAFTHKIRKSVDAIIVGANTARIDDPKLTARVGHKTYYPARVVISSNGLLSPDLVMFNEPGESIVVISSSEDKSSLMKLEQAGARIIKVAEHNGRPSLADLMRQLGKIGCLSVLIEGGAEIAASAFAERVVDKVLYFYAPRIIGGREAVGAVGGFGAEKVASSVSLDKIRIRHFGSDIAVEGYAVYPD